MLLKASCTAGVRLSSRVLARHARGPGFHPLLREPGTVVFACSLSYSRVRQEDCLSPGVLNSLNNTRPVGGETTGIKENKKG
jgi:hypothetical protein